MPILTKAQLEALNQASFPDQSSEAITPAILRTYNTSTIDTLVDSLDTGSFVTTAMTGSNLITASASGTNVITFTKGDATTFGVTIATGSAINTGSFVTTNTNQTITGVKSFQANVGVEGSNSIQFGTFDTNRIFSSGGKNITLGAISGDGANTVNLTAGTSGVALNSNFVNIRTVGTNVGNSILLESTKIIISGSTDITGSLSISGNLTASLQDGFTYVGNGSGRTQAVSTSSLATSIPAGTISGSSQITALGFVSSSVTGSSLVTGSVAGNILTFTKGNGSQFSLTVAAGDTGSFATTGSNLFYGNQTISGSTNKNGINFLTGSSAFFVGQDQVGRFIISSSNQSRWMELSNDNGYAEIYAQSTNFNNSVALRGNTEARKITQEVGYPVIINGTLSASLATGYAFVGGADGYSKQVPTASFSSASLVTGSVNVNVLTFTKGDGSTFDLTVAASGSVVPGTVSGSAQITAFGFVSSSGGDTGSLMRTGSVSGNVLTFTKGDASTFTLTVATGSSSTIDTGSFATTGSNNFKGVESIGDIAGTSTGEVYLLGRSGSLVIGNSTATPTYAALAHLSSSQINGNTNLIFKTNSSTGDTIISGSNNIFTNPAAVTTGYKRYIGGSNNLYLNSTNGINSQITESAASVSGNRPTMNNNIFNGTGNFSINQAVNTADHDYSNNIFNGNGNVTINALSHTGSISVTGNITPNGSITINASSASVAEIGTGISGSGNVNVRGNLIQGGGSITITSPRFFLPANTQSTLGNFVAGGSITVTNISSSAAVTSNNNLANSVISYTNAGAAGLGLHTLAGGFSQNIGGATLIASASSMNFNFNTTSGNNLTVTNQAFSGSLGVGQFNILRNIFYGQNGILLITGSVDGTGNTAGAFTDNAVIGKSNTIFSNQTGAGLHNSFISNVVGGEQLIISASNSFNSTIGGGAYFGRYNANDGVRNKTGQTVFSVGTGTSTTRKTGFLIDSGSNTFVEGSLNVSGSSVFNGNTTISGSLTQSGSVSIQGETIFVNKNGNNTSVILGQFAMGNITGSVEKSIAIGQGAMRYASGSSLDSIAIGFNTLPVATGVNNFALGSQALAENTSGGQNTAIGTGALNKNTTGIKNTAIGDGSGFANVSGSNNTYIGPSAGNNIFGGNNLLLGGYQGVGEVVNNNIILSTGGGSIKAQYNETAWLMKAPVNFTTGSNQQAGTAVLDGANPGTVVVSNSLVTANSIIMLTKQTLTNAHMVAVSSKGAGTFTITSNGNGDTDTVGWFIINNS